MIFTNTEQKHMMLLPFERGVFVVLLQSGMSHKTCLRGFGGNGSNAWTSAVSHVGRTSIVHLRSL